MSEWIGKYKELLQTDEEFRAKLKAAAKAYDDERTEEAVFINLSYIDRYNTADRDVVSSVSAIFFICSQGILYYYVLCAGIKRWLKGEVAWNTT